MIVMKNTFIIYFAVFLMVIIVSKLYEEKSISYYDMKGIEDKEFFNKMSEEYMEIFHDFYKNNPNNLDKDSYYNYKKKEKNSNYWRGLVEKAKFYHNNYINEMFAF
jgi:hypothetical protein